MSAMDAASKKAVAGILREYGKTLCELRAAKEMLAFLAKNRRVLVEWEQALEKMKTQPGYRDPAKALEALALELERTGRVQ
jgi:hypothetical protein